MGWESSHSYDTPIFYLPHFLCVFFLGQEQDNWILVFSCSSVICETRDPVSMSLFSVILLSNWGVSSFVFIMRMFQCYFFHLIEGCTLLAVDRPAQMILVKLGIKWLLCPSIPVIFSKWSLFSSIHLDSFFPILILISIPSEAPQSRVGRGVNFRKIFLFTTSRHTPRGLESEIRIIRATSSFCMLFLLPPWISYAMLSGEVSEKDIC